MVLQELLRQYGVSSDEEEEPVDMDMQVDATRESLRVELDREGDWEDLEDFIDFSDDTKYLNGEPEP